MTERELKEVAKNLQQAGGLCYSEDFTSLIKCSIYYTGELIIDSRTTTIEQGAFTDCILKNISLHIPADVTNIHKQSGLFGRSVKYISVDKDNPRYYAKKKNVLARYDGEENTYYELKDKNEVDKMRFYSEKLYNDGRNDICSHNLPEDDKGNNHHPVIEINLATPTPEETDINDDNTESKTLFNGTNGNDNKEIYELLSPEYAVVKEGIEEISDYCFIQTPNIKAVKLPSTLKTIGWRAFSECFDLKEVALPENVVKIDDDAFYHTFIETLRIPKTMKEINTAALRSVFETKNDIKAEVAGKNPYLSSIAGCLYNKEQTELLYIPRLSESRAASIAIPETVTKIASDAWPNPSLYNKKDFCMLWFQTPQPPVCDTEYLDCFKVFIPYRYKDNYLSNPEWKRLRNIQFFGT